MTARIWARVRHGVLGLDGRPDAVVSMSPNPRGLYQWAAGNVSGAEQSLDAAKRRVEEIIPRNVFTLPSRVG